MSEFFWIGLVVALVAIFCGYLIGHYHAQAQVKALLDQVGPGVKSDLSTAEQDLIDLWRKHIGKTVTVTQVSTVPPVTPAP